MFSREISPWSLIGVEKKFSFPNHLYFGWANNVLVLPYTHLSFHFIVFLSFYFNVKRFSFLWLLAFQPLLESPFLTIFTKELLFWVLYAVLVVHINKVIPFIVLCKVLFST